MAVESDIPSKLDSFNKLSGPQLALRGITKYHSLDCEAHPLSCILVASVVFLSYSAFVCSQFRSCV